MQRFIKPIIFCLSLVPFSILIFNGLAGRLTANPIEDITHFTGDWTIYFLLITLSITPLRRLTGINALIRFRRMLGLFAFFYSCLHFTTYFVLDQFFDWEAILDDIALRPYITVGFTAFVLLIPLAMTSTKKMIQRLGNRWRQTALYGLCDNRSWNSALLLACKGRYPYPSHPGPNLRHLANIAAILAKKYQKLLVFL